MFVVDVFEGNIFDVFDLIVLLFEFWSVVEKILLGRFRWFRDDFLYVIVRGFVN